jgi:hypothetical protein
VQSASARDLGGPIGAAVVDDDHLAGQPGVGKGLEGLGDAEADRFLLVEGREDDRDIEAVVGSAASGRQGGLARRHGQVPFRGSGEVR